MKVFSIGFNKTGTSSLHQFFVRCGLRSLHDDRWPAASWLASGQRLLAEFDAYTDGEQSNFPQLKHWFPDAAFVLNTRDERDWLRSRAKHVLRLGSFSTQEALVHPGLGKMAREFFNAPELAIRKWQLEKRLYERQVREYFEGHSAFLEIDVTAMRDWSECLAEHLLKHGIVANQHASNDPIHANRRENQRVPDQDALRHIFELIDHLH